MLDAQDEKPDPDAAEAEAAEPSAEATPDEPGAVEATQDVAEHETAEDLEEDPAEDSAEDAEWVDDNDVGAPSGGFRWPRGLQASATRRALLLTALGGLLIAGLVTALPSVGTGPGRLAGYIDSDPVPSTGSKSNAAFSRAVSGDCLNWPDGTPESATIVSCADDHRFEVAESVDMRTFPGTEYGPTAPPPSPARIQQINTEQCEPAVRRYLGPKFDPNSKFTVSMLWSGDRAWRQAGERRMLCGLQLPGPNNQQVAFKGKVAEIDQSKVWPAGTCLGIDSTTNQPVDVPVDCAAPHAMEVTGTVNLGEKFPNALPPEAEQDGFIKDACTKMTDAYLAPVKLRTTTLTLIYPTVSLPSWSAGSREVACNIGATLGNGGWATLVNSAKGQLLINGQAPVPPPDIPQERLTLPQIPVQVPTQQPSAPSQQTPSTPPGNQHLPNQQPVVTPTREPSAPAPQAPAPQGPPPAPDGGAPPPADNPLPAEPAPVN
ncbi:septum formation family protein [Mycobacterium asiaticum]|uniref:septum formation family protein n=1 Tax=Mycobacterium asiaticum TaxID=1790 RepID=UPI000AABA89F|nr:septum formation family protein [Mycobacterium asiaticum]